MVNESGLNLFSLNEFVIYFERFWEKEIKTMMNEILKGNNKIKIKMVNAFMH